MRDLLTAPLPFVCWSGIAEEAYAVRHIHKHPATTCMLCRIPGNCLPLPCAGSPLCLQGALAQADCVQILNLDKCHHRPCAQVTEEHKGLKQSLHTPFISLEPGKLRKPSSSGDRSQAIIQHCRCTSMSFACLCVGSFMDSVCCGAGEFAVGGCLR